MDATGHIDGEGGSPPGLRARLAAFLDLPATRNAFLAVIVFNAATLGLATSGRISTAYGDLLAAFDVLVLAIFLAEMAAKLYVGRARFLRSAWNVFDLLVVLLSLVPASGGIAVLRILRVLRVTRLLAGVPHLRAVVVALLTALPGMAAVILLLGLVFYVFGVMATGLFDERFPQWFGTLGESLYSLFQIMTLESWSMGIVRPVMESYPQAWALFVPFIAITTFSVLNRFVGLIVSTMQAAVVAEDNAETDRLERLVTDRTAMLQAEIADLRALIERNGGKGT